MKRFNFHDLICRTLKCSRVKNESFFICLLYQFALTRNKFSALDEKEEKIEWQKNEMAALEEKTRMHKITERRNLRAHGKVLKFKFNEIPNIRNSKHSSPALVRVCVHKSPYLSYEIPFGTANVFIYSSREIY